MPDEPFLARPGQSLDAHLDGVVTNADALIPADATTPADDSLSQLVATVAHLHDIGKLTSYFQDYLRDDDRRPTELERHARVGALLTLHALGAQGFEKAETIAGFYAVQKHHGALPNITEAHLNWTTREERYDPLRTQLADIETTARETADRRVTTATDGALSWDAIRTENVTAYRGALDGFAPDSDFYQLLLRVWSTLTCADKLDAAGVTLSPTVRGPDPDSISFDTESTGVQRRLNEYRSDARERVRERLLEYSDQDQDVFTLTLPTGFGKTAAGLDAGLSLASKRERPVIYALPYTTVIDQVDGVIREQFGVSPETEPYTKHHHLADTRTRVDADDEPVSDGTEALYGESWQAGLVLTTFVQLFESLAGPENVQSIKLPALQDAVVIVDEPQALPNRWWHLLSRLSAILTEEYDATLVLMTATQPRFIDEYNVDLEPEELVPNPGDHVDFLRKHERVRFRIDESLQARLEGDRGGALNPDRAGARIVDDVESSADNVLAVNNTIDSAVAVGDAVRQYARDQVGGVISLNDQLSGVLEDQPDVVPGMARGERAVSHVATALLDRCGEAGATSSGIAFATLTAALRPCDRSVLIEAMRAIVDPNVDTPLDELPFVVAATQLVEAGVDVSADRVYRDFAPVPSLVQAAGRCNRSFEDETGEVTLWLLDGDTRVPCEAVYARRGDRLRPAAAALRDAVGDHGLSIPEATMVSDVVEEYYECLHAADHTTDRTDTLASAVDEARGTDLRDASLIEDHTEDALVLCTEADAGLLRRYLHHREDRMYEDAKSAFGVLKNLLASAPETDVASIATTESVVKDLGFDTLQLNEFEIVDARHQTRYDIRGRGLRIDGDS